MTSAFNVQVGIESHYSTSLRQLLRLLTIELADNFASGNARRSSLMTRSVRRGQEANTLLAGAW
jgi:hypothetical protein